MSTTKKGSEKMAVVNTTYATPLKYMSRLVWNMRFSERACDTVTTPATQLRDDESFHLCDIYTLCSKKTCDHVFDDKLK